MAAAVAAVLAWRLLGVAPERMPPHPLASLTASSVASVEFLEAEGAQRLDSKRARVVVGAIAALRNASALNGRTVNWAGARMIRARTRSGVLLSLQAVPAEQGAMIRITADAPAGTAPAVRAEAEAIRSLRNKAYRLNGPELGSLFAPTSDSGER